TGLETKVLEVVGARPEGVDLYGIVAQVRDERDRVKEALEKLDYDCYVIRKFQGDGWTTRNLYVPFEMRDDLVPDAGKTIVLSFLRAYGPAPLSSIKEYERFYWDQVQVIIDMREEAGSGGRGHASGSGEGEVV